MKIIFSLLLWNPLSHDLSLSLRHSSQTKSRFSGSFQPWELNFYEPEIFDFNLTHYQLNFAKSTTIVDNVKVLFNLIKGDYPLIIIATLCRHV
jgi:hypothetical protein